MHLRSLALMSILAVAIPEGSTTAFADSWLPPTKRVYQSSNNQARLTVTPRDIASPLAYFEDKTKGATPAGLPQGSQNKAARGLLEKRGPDGRWTVVWDRPLVNDVSPVSALVGDSGQYAATFDNWNSMGIGDHVVVIYGPDGSVVRSHPLTDILPEFYIKALLRTASSIWWSGEHSISERKRKLVLKVVVPSEEDAGKMSNYVDVAVDLPTGKVLHDGQAWQRALAQAKRVAKIQQAADEDRRKVFIMPLLAPKTNDERAWHTYLREAFYRSAPDWKVNFPVIQVLRAPSSSDYKPSEGWLREELLEKNPADTIMIASPASPENLVVVLADAARQIKPGALRKARIYAAVPKTYYGRVAAALAPTGAKVIPLDPEKPIPQRKERLREVR